MNHAKRMKKCMLIFGAVILILAGLYFFITVRRVRNLDTWLGRYSCSTLIEGKNRGHGIYAEFEIIIFKIGKNYYAKLSGDGWMLLTRSLARVEGDRNSIDIIFMDTLPPDMLYTPDRYKEGERLLTLSYIDSELHTTWYELKIENPSIHDTKGEVEGVYFKKDL